MTECNVGIYCRLSQEDMRSGESVSIENQKEMLTKYVTEKKWNLVDVYSDDGYSGTDFNRPAVMRLLDDAKLGRINTIVCKDLSRFGRNYIEVGQYVDYIFPMYNIRFIALGDNIDTANRNSTAMDMMPIVNVFNEWHAASTSKKVRTVKRENAMQGKYLSSVPAYGYSKGKPPLYRPIVNPKTAPIVKEIFERFSQGEGKLTIAKSLNSRGILTPLDSRSGTSGHCWRERTIDKILKNPIYEGDMVQLRRTTVSHKNHKEVRKPPSEWVTVKDTHEPIVSRELWQKVNDRLTRNRGKATESGEACCLSGLLVCADCGRKMHLINRKKGYPAYICNSYSFYGKDVCTAHYIRQDEIESIVLKSIRQKAKTVIGDEQAKELWREQTKTVRNTASIDRRIDELTELIARAYEDSVLRSTAVFEKVIQKYADELDTLEQEKQKVPDPKAEDEFVRQLKKFADNTELTREMCVALIDRVLVGKKGDPREVRVIYKS